MPHKCDLVDAVRDYKVAPASRVVGSYAVADSVFGALGRLHDRLGPSQRGLGIGSRQAQFRNSITGPESIGLD